MSNAVLNRASTLAASWRTVILFAAMALHPCIAPAARVQDIEWTLKQDTTIPPRYDHAMAYDSARGVTVLYGGITNGAFRETWEWDGAEWTKRSAGAPFVSDGHAMAYDAARGVTVLFGGSSFSATWEWDGTAWAERMVTGALGAV